MGSELSMEEVERINKQMNGFDERLRQTEIALERNNILTERNTCMMEKFSDILDTVKETMIKMQANADENCRTIRALSDNVSKLSDKINAVDEKVDEYKEYTDGKIAENEDKNKLDTRDITKKWIEYLVTGGGAVAILSYILNQIMK